MGYLKPRTMRLLIPPRIQPDRLPKSRFRRLRDELWWEVREEFQNGLISIPDDPTLIEELSAYHYKEDENGLVKVESKEELRERDFDSTNKADCLMMRRFYTPFDVQRMKAANSSSRHGSSDVDWRTV